ncbi:MAG: hypothetical protein K8S98_12440 [Planctomycetes bacterium]|nr:hypothetical protein [Planctomycetota bacterium]
MSKSPILGFFSTAQDLLARHERSSGMRPFLIVIGLCFALFAASMPFSMTDDMRRLLAWFLLAAPLIGFFLIFCVKALQDPNFCRSEKHVEHLAKIQVARLGSKDAPMLEDDRAFELEDKEGKTSVPRIGP